MNWTITYFSESVQKEILAMAAGFLGRYLRYTDRMEVFGPDLGLPHTRSMGEGLFELRLKAAAGIARVFYCTMVLWLAERSWCFTSSLRKQIKPRPENWKQPDGG